MIRAVAAIFENSPLFDKIDIIFIIATIISVLLQILLCFKAKRSIVRAIPILFYAIQIALNSLLMFIALIGIIDIGAFLLFVGLIFNIILLTICVVTYAICRVVGGFMGIDMFDE
ncbi:MAG: hypothetical protein HFE63_04775 [Clostridiales bacterium]|nr:hypothetical protein [Clostridiales bacterium]